MLRVQRVAKQICIRILRLFLEKILISRKVLRIRIRRLNIFVLPGVFRPDISYSTYLLIYSSLRLLKNRKYFKICDVCAGSGIIGLILSRAFNRHVVLIDISRTCIHNCILNTKVLKLDSNVDIILSDSCKAIKKNAVDFVVINPPYLPCDGKYELCCGSDLEILRNILKCCIQVSRYGVLYTLSSLTGIKCGIEISRVKTPIDTIYVMLISKCSH